tara:strand:+ start:615 stop:1361 length:747 start_codon:yes stop_codon:yes gene_type:complete
LKNYIKILLFFIFFSSCGLLKSSSKQSKLNKDLKNNKTSTSFKVNDYLSKYSEFAILEMKRYKIPASITLAQGLLESSYGRARLAVEANNHFGIKCHKSWRGKKIYHDDDEKNECFRKYRNVSDSYRDHSLFLKNRSRYSSLFNLDIKNYRAWAKGLKKAGYATDPNYADKLISLIDRYELYRFDKIKRRDLITQQSDKSKKIIHNVKTGDTLFSISKKYNVPINQIIINNNLQNNLIKVGQILIITL